MPCTLAHWHTRRDEWRQWRAQRRQLKQQLKAEFKQQLRSAFASAVGAAPPVSSGHTPTLSATDAHMLRTERILTLHRLGWWLAIAGVITAVALTWLRA